MRELHQQLPDPQEPLLVWGYHQLWHGAMTRAVLNDIAMTRPVIVWHRSFHELVMNDDALEWLGISEAEAGNRHQIDYDRGRFYENGLSYAINRLNPYLLEPKRYREGLRRLAEVVHFGGHTTICDMAAGLFDFEREWETLQAAFEHPDTPFRVEMVPHAGRLRGVHGGDEGALAFIRTLPERNTHRLRFGDHVKLFADGAFFSQLAQVAEPGYIDGHIGEWLTTPEALEASARVYWNAGYKIHVHCTGDLGVELTLDILEKLQWERPRFRHGFTFEYFGFCTPEQVQRIAALGAHVSANVYYLHELSHIYAEQGIGFERASQMARLGTCVREGVRTTVHSDFTMAPALPLNSAWVAANRLNCQGQVMCAEERLSVEQALRTITTDAAHVLGLEHDIGSIRAGKKADFTVLDDSPFRVGVAHLNQLNVLGTVFEGRVFMVS